MKLSFPQFRSLFSWFRSLSGLQRSVRQIGTFAIMIYLLTSPAYAIYDPRTLPLNKLGVHILNPSELSAAAALVNSHGGDWGYVTVPIQPGDRDKDKWQTFMRETRELHLIPIIRITTIPQGGTWQQGNDTDLVDFANFLSELDWPISNRYIVLFNEVNRSQEWGGVVNPEKYAQIVKNAYQIFKERSSDFFLLGPSLDSALPNSQTSLSATAYLSRMSAYDPLVWTYFDGWSSHSYPNPGFTSAPSRTGLQSILGYQSEIKYLKLAPKPVFITETGWDQTKLTGDQLASYWRQAWDIWQADYNLVAVTPFVLQGGAQFAPFSLQDGNGGYTASGNALINLPKSIGLPQVLAHATRVATPSSAKQPRWTPPFFKSSQALLKLENIFRTLLGFPVKAHATLKDLPLLLELAVNPKHWEHGLSDRADLGSSDGMLFIFPQSHVPIFWMKDMHFPIDIIWISHGLVVDITHSAPVSESDHLPTYSPKVPVEMVLEVNSGWAEENGVIIGDNLILNN